MYIAQAFKGDNVSWKFWITTLVCGGIFIINFISYLLTSPEDMEAAYEMLKSIPKILGLILNLIPFVVLLIFLIVFVVFMHKRSFLSLTTSRSKIDFKRILFSFLLISVLTIGGFVYSYYSTPGEVVWNFEPGKFTVLVIVSLILFPFQIGFEEYFFRGYLMQQIGVAVKNKWFPLIFTSVLFGVAHSANPEVAEMGYITMVFYIGTGLLLGIMTLMDEGLELALGFHLGNNLLAALLVTSEWSALQTDAMFKYVNEQATDAMVNEMLASVAISYPIIIIILAFTYKWKNWGDKLFGKVVMPVEQVTENGIGK
ncbi:CPBP family intramembrane glutamic endopeptidase [Spongiivirga citrea]|uniref:CPBP family intramembrane metalloprotease n=1 Tax=Spongiivirga citrea TaxID=1481457 RepID=A0A6M0CM01_9FLAO|nr:CPBP family intramembrane glutamic endopeptidase [Spongiivirga citrea]NER16477.1 CPBP family intramembrane metalloprotease [Spongiivirga citrea]